MTPWEQLTERGRLRRLRDLATAALERYPIHPTGVCLVGGFTNAVFRIDTPDGPFALRIDHHQEHSDDDVAVELAWLGALAGTDLDVCRAVAASDGSAFVHAEARGIPGSRRCALFEWVPGVPLGERLGDEHAEVRYHRLGRLSAGLHGHAATFRPPHRPMAWDRVFYWPEEVDPVVWDRPQHAHHFTDGRREVVERAIAAVDPAFGRLDPSETRIVHGDLHPGNVHSYRSRLIALDFEDVMWAHPVQDVATTLFYERTNPRHPDLRAAFEDGYRSVARWPVTYDGEIEHFMAARTVMFVNYVCNIQDDPSDYLGVAIPRLEGFLRTWT